jgi:hypothetical protein
VVDIIEILVHWHAGRNNSEIAQSLGVDRKTVRKYAAAAEAAGMVPGGPPLSEAEWDARARAWFPELADTLCRPNTRSRGLTCCFGCRSDTLNGWLAGCCSRSPTCSCAGLLA